MDTMEKGTARTVLTKFETAYKNVEGDKLIFPIKPNKPVKEAKSQEHIDHHLAALAAFGLVAVFVAGKPPRHEIDIVANHQEIGQLIKSGYKIPGLMSVNDLPRSENAQRHL